MINLGSTKDGSIQYKLEGGTFSSEAPKATDAGEYTIYYQIIGDNNHNNSETFSITVNIAKAISTYNAPIPFTYLTYTGETLDLIQAGSSNDGILYYSLDSTNPGDFSTELPTTSEAGIHNIYYFVKGDSNHLDSEPEYVTVNIAKIKPNFVAPTIKDNLIYDGTPQELINPGSSLDGTVLYSLDNINYSSEIPQGKEAGNYIVYYYILIAGCYAKFHCSSYKFRSWNVIQQEFQVHL